MGARVRFGSHLWGGALAAKRHDGSLDSQFSDVTLEELREFLEADMTEVNADPAFKERLRKKLWDLVQAQSGGPPSREGEF